ncbi:DUF4129 domain-containing protein [Halolamina sp. CBA1230]|uniref:DUF4129 domain-containing protein n=1 Tax=Halolamina sp. CBA1230 TaxID=1853690 RepID=UPI0009A22542|nr:DUF4129 domain-containing protein [Halolamina sp. CBA1230]QKY20484.1 DUF4129 domain-containing protein [Halolamina sp. CBA1230]
MRFSDPGRLLLVLVALLCLTQGAAGIGINPEADGAGVGTASVGADTALQTTPNNTTVQQENPDDVGESGDTAALQSYLVQSLADRLGESSIRISAGQYEQGRALLGDEYDSTLEKYVDVEGETDSAAAFDQAAESQRELGTTAQEYNETYREYQQARENGNEARARELARELGRLAGDANESARRLTASYTRIENTTGANLSAAQQRALNVSEEISQQQQTVITETFVATRLSVGTDADRVSFAAPATVTGQLTLANGSAVRNETVAIRIGDRVESVRTGQNGTFTVEYRPVSVQNGTDTLPVAYQPAPESPYLGSNASVDVTVTQTTATLTVDSRSATASFGDEVAVSGQAAVDGTPVPGARVRVTVDGVTLGTVTTGSNGSYAVVSDLPASVASGETDVEAVIVPSDRAVRSAVASTPLRVESTETALSVNASRATDGRVRLTGQLTTTEGAPVAGETIELRIEGTTVATVETDSAGAFEQLVTPQDGLDGVVSVEAIYDAPSSNLAGATAETSVDLDAPPADRESAPGEEGTESGADSDGRDDGPLSRGAGPLSLELLAGGGALVLSVLVIAWVIRRDGERGPTNQPQSPGTSTTPTSDSTDNGGTMVDHAAALREDGESDAAIRALYNAVRRSLSVGDETQTHWEFYTTASERLQPDTTETLERLTQAYERVVYSPDELDKEQADALLDDTAALLDEGDGESAS